MSTGDPVGPKTAEGCLAGLAAVILTLTAWFVVVGLAALHVLGYI